MATKRGVVKKTKLSEYENIRRNGLVSIKLESGDSLIWAKLTSGEDDVLLVSHEGKSIRFAESEVRHTGRDTMGVRGILLKTGDFIVGMDMITAKNKKVDFFTVMEKGIGKKNECHRISQTTTRRTRGKGGRDQRKNRKSCRFSNGS